MAPEEANYTDEASAPFSSFSPRQIHWGIRSLIPLDLSLSSSTFLSGFLSLAESSARPLEPTSNCPDGSNGGAGLAGKEGEERTA
jgi:hypothetical protein